MALLRFKKGARQRAVRINKHLRMARLDMLPVAPLKAGKRVVLGAPEVAFPPDKASSKAKKRSTVHFSFILAPFQAECVVHNGLPAHRKAQLPAARYVRVAPDSRWHVWSAPASSTLQLYSLLVAQSNFTGNSHLHSLHYGPQQTTGAPSSK